MWRLIQLCAIAALVLVVACSSSDDDSGPTGPSDTRQRVAAYVTTSAPATDDPFDPLWDSVDVDTVPIRRSGAIINSMKALPTHFELQIIRSTERLFVRCAWADPESNLRISPCRCISNDGTALFIKDSSEFDFGEDQLLVMFDGAANDGWDTWRWLSYRTGTVGLAEGMIYRNGALIADASSIEVYTNNVVDAGLPTYLSVEGPDFTGDTLYMSEATTDWTGFQLSGWTNGQTIPGYLIDSAAARQVKASPQSRWDILSAWDYDESSGIHTVVLSRKLNTGFFSGDDVDLTPLDSVAVRIGMLDDLPDLLDNNSSQQAFTSELIVKFE